MNIFISWSGPLSKAIATAFYEWIGDVLQMSEPWMSEEDIPSGSIWFDSVNDQLKNTGYGILIITEHNQASPWLLWEAGALFGGFKTGRRRVVVPILTNIRKSELISPLDKFQARSATNKKDMLKLLRDINRDLDKSITEKQLTDQLDRCWDRWVTNVENALQKIVDTDDKRGKSARLFRQAAEKFLTEKDNNTYKYRLMWVRHYIDKIPIDRISDDSLALFVEDRSAGTCPEVAGKRVRGRAKASTISAEIAVVIRVLKAAQKWGWIEHLPAITKRPAQTSRTHFVLTPSEQSKLIQKMPVYARNAAIFAVNTGTDRAILQDLEWSWLSSAPGLGIRYFTVPNSYSKRNGGRLILLNEAARAVIDEQEDAGNDRYVFTGSRGGKLNIGKPFKTAWIKAGLPVGGGLALGVSNLHWTFEKRLENARVVREDREFLQWRGDIFRENRGPAPDLLHLLNCLEKISTPPQVAG